jgi:hypothetical protein
MNRSMLKVFPIAVILIGVFGKDQEQKSIMLE